MLRTTLALLLALSISLSTAPDALAQRGRTTVRLTGPSADLPAPTPHGRAPIAPDVTTPRGQAFASGQRPVVLMTGYWPPTNEMLRRFSPKPSLNPGGWIGSNWRNRGYDVVAFFPTFNNPNCGNCGKGNGDLEVDYQDTVADFDRLTEAYKPIAVITFSRGFPDTSWEVEMNQFNRRNWIGDFVAPTQPTPRPPDASIPRNEIRASAQPVARIVDEIAASGIPVQPYICESGDGGGYLSEFIAYLGVWYQARHNDPLDPDWCIAGGHVHVGGQISWPVATQAAEETLDIVLDHVDEVLSCAPILPFCDAGVNSRNTGAQLSAIGWPSISDNDLRLIAQRLPGGTSGITFYGPQRASTPYSPLGDGVLCIDGPLTRLPVAMANTDRVMQIPLDMSVAPLGSGAAAVTVGSTWSFQTWYRDVGFGVGHNTTNALEITFCP